MTVPTREQYEAYRDALEENAKADGYDHESSDYTIAARAALDALVLPLIDAHVAPDRLREALLNVSVHAAHNPEAPRELLIALLVRCGEIAREALRTTSSASPAPIRAALSEVTDALADLKEVVRKSGKLEGSEHRDIGYRVLKAIDKGRAALHHSELLMPEAVDG